MDTRDTPLFTEVHCVTMEPTSVENRALLTLLMSRAQSYLQASCIAANPLNFAVRPSTKTLWQHSVPTLSCYQSHPHRAVTHKQVWPCVDLPRPVKKCKRGQRSCLDNHRAFTRIRGPFCTDIVSTLPMRVGGEKILQVEQGESPSASGWGEKKRDDQSYYSPSSNM